MSAPYPAHRPVTCAEARAADRESAEAFGVPSLVLLEHAGSGLARVVHDLLPRGAEVAVLCGPGMNGADGYVCARFLAGWGVRVRVVRCAAEVPASGDAALEHALLSRELRVLAAPSLAEARVVEGALDGAAVVVDALFGVGLSRPLAPPYPEWIERINAAPTVRVAADVPSGLAGDDGIPRPVAVRAHVTAAMGFVKRSCTTPSGAAHAGRLVEVDIGLPGAIHRRYLA